MAKLPISILLLAGSLALSGCAAGWYRPDGTNEQSAADKLECQSEAHKMAPEAFLPVLVREATRTPVVTRCETHAQQSVCTTSGGDMRRAEYETVDINADQRYALFSDCMQRKGYKFHFWK